MKIENSENIGCSAPSLIGPTTLPLLGMPLEGWRILTNGLMGYDGIEWRPLRSAAERQLLGGLASSYGKRGICSLEQSYRGERTWKEASGHKNPRIAQVSYLLMPHRTDSLKTLSAIQRVVGNVLTTVYPPQDFTEENLQSNIANKSIQPEVNLLGSSDPISFEQLIDSIEESGYKITLDLFHFLQLRKRISLPPIEVCLKRMFPLIEEVQFSAARTDMNPNDQDTKQAYKDLLTGSTDSEAARMFIKLSKMGYQGLVVTEVPSFAISPHPLGLIRGHRLFIRNIKRMRNIK